LGDPATVAASIVGGVGIARTLGVATIAGTGGGACADGDCTNEVQSVWRLDPFSRGRDIEQVLGRSPNLAQNFPVIDRFENGVATSIKSIDLGASSYQNTAVLGRAVQRYINTLANWQGQRTLWGGVTIRQNQITSRVVELAIPGSNGTPEQLDVLTQMQNYATSVGIRLDIIRVP
jgi:filamentous hemagglutinin